MTNSRYTTLAVDKDTHRALKTIQEEYERKGITLRADQIVRRSLGCLLDSIGRGAWLSPAEAAPLLEERVAAAFKGTVISFFEKFGMRVDVDVDLDKSLATVTLHPTEGADVRAQPIVQQIPLDSALLNDTQRPLQG